MRELAGWLRCSGLGLVGSCVLGQRLCYVMAGGQWPTFIDSRVVV